jgi:hypothetical protein
MFQPAITAKYHLPACVSFICQTFSLITFAPYLFSISSILSREGIFRGSCPTIALFQLETVDRSTPSFLYIPRSLISAIKARGVLSIVILIRLLQVLVYKSEIPPKKGLHQDPPNATTYHHPISQTLATVWACLFLDWDTMIQVYLLPLHRLIRQISSSRRTIPFLL